MAGTFASTEHRADAVPATATESIFEVKPAAPLVISGHQHVASRALRVSLCLVVWNELEGCKLDVPGLPLEAFDEVYAIDGGSTDGTQSYLASRGIAVHPQRRRGYNAAIIDAFACCTTDAVVLYHPKGSIAPAEVLRCRQLLADGYDLAIGSRMIPGGRNEEDAKLLKPRKWFVCGLALLAGGLWKRTGRARRGTSGEQALIWDVLHGFRGMRREQFFAIEPLPDGVSMDLEMVVRSYRMGYRVGEFASCEKPRPHSKTHFPAFSTGRKLLAYIGHELRRTVPGTPSPSHGSVGPPGAQR